jgi:multiple sugar transport system permease protein
MKIIKANFGKGIFKIPVLYILTLIIMVAIIFPIYWLIVTSIKPPIEWIIYPPVFLPSRIYLDTFKELIGNPDVRNVIYNSLISSISGTVITLAIASTFAYAVARLKIRISRFLVIWIIVNRIIPPITIVIPYFIIMRTFGLIDTIGALIISRVYLSLPFALWLMIGFYKEIPHEIDEAAKIDGCSFFRRYFSIGLPLGKVGLATAGTFAFIGSWNELLFAITITGENAKTLPVLIATYIQDNAIRWGEMTALSVLSLIPVFIFAMSIQKFFISGLTLGSVKG